MHRQKLSDVHPLAETTVSAFAAQRIPVHKQIKVLARKPVDVEVNHPTATSKKKQRFSSEDFAGFYSPSHNLQKSKIDLNRVLPRTPSNDKNQECQSIKPNNSMNEPLDQNAPAAMLLTKTPPTRSQLRVRLKLSEISNDAQYFKQTHRFNVVEANVKPEQQAIQIAELERQVMHLMEENARLREDNARQLEVNSKVQQNLEDTLRRFTEWQSQEHYREELICQLQSQISELKGQNQFLTKNLQSKSEVVNYLHNELESTLLRLREIQSCKQLCEFTNLEEKVSCLEGVVKDTNEKLHREQDKTRYLEIQLRILKQKQLELDGAQSAQQERELLIEKNRRLKREAVRLKNQLIQRQQNDVFFELSP